MSSRIRCTFFTFFMLLLSVFLAIPALAAEAQKKPVAQPAPVAQKKPAAKPAVTAVAMKSPAPAGSKKAVPATGKKLPPGESPERLQQDLDVFAKKCVVSMNNQLKPGPKNKEVAPHPNGGYVARYMTVDPDSLQTSYNSSANKYVKYIGKMIYHEVEYSCTAPTREQALAGPFSEINRVPITELIKYMKGKWTY